MQSAATDITGDGLTDLPDLAILTGHYDPQCDTPQQIPPAEATAEVTEPATEVTPEAPEFVILVETTPELTEEPAQP